MTSMFKSEAARTEVLEWFERIRGQLRVATESRSVPTRFGAAHVLVSGPADAPALVLLHGAMASSALVLRELWPLAERFRVYSVDVVGQSVKSADVRPSVKNLDYGHWLNDVFEGLGLERAMLVGISWGGFVSTRFAMVAPQKIARLALLVPAGVVSGPFWAGLTQVGLPMMLYRAFPSEKRLKKAMSGLLTTTDDDWSAYLGTAFLAYTMNMEIPALAQVDELRAFSSPTMVVAADKDVSFPGEALIARSRQLFSSLERVELLRECRHSPPTTDAFRRELSSKLISFFDGTPPQTN